MTAITTVFPNAILLGCLFHFIRALWRKADQLTIKKSKIRRAHVKRCIALAFLPKEYVQDGWLYVRGECFKEECILRFNEYFYKTWLKETSNFAAVNCVFSMFIIEQIMQMSPGMADLIKKLPPNRILLFYWTDYTKTPIIISGYLKDKDLLVKKN